MAEERPDPFYEWLDHDRIRELVHRTDELEPGERLVFLKGLVPRLVQDLGVGGFSELLRELDTKGRRFEEARTHPGEGSEQRRTPGEAIRGPTPDGHLHLDEPRDVNRPGGREAERALEAELWEERTQKDGKAGAIPRQTPGFLRSRSRTRSGR